MDFFAAVKVNGIKMYDKKWAFFAIVKINGLIVYDV